MPHIVDAMLRARLVPAMLLLAAASPTALHAKDPGVVILRDVNPRIAYRQIPPEDMPIHTEATVFPATAFDDALDSALGERLGDRDLGAHASAGLAANALNETLAGVGTRMPTPAMFDLRGTGAGAAPLGLGATVGGAIGGATRNLGGTIGGAVSQAVSGATTPGGGR